MRSYSTYKTPVIPASGVIQQAVTGNIFVVVECTAPFKVSFNGSEAITMKRGRRLMLEPGENFTNFTFQNETASPLQVTYYAGSMDVRDDNQAFVQFSPTLIVANGGSEGTAYLDAGGLIVLTAGSFIPLPGVTSSGQRRKQIIITNLDASLDLRIRKTFEAARSMASIFPRTAWTLESDAAMALHNHNGSSVSCQILETFYTDTYDTTAD